MTEAKKEIAGGEVAAQIDSVTEIDSSDPDPNAANRLKPLPGSTTMKPTMPPQAAVEPKKSPDHTEISLKSDEYKKERDDNESTSGSFLGQGDCEIEEDQPAEM